MSTEVDDIYQQIRENLDKVKARERSVADKERQVAEEASKIATKTKELDDTRLMLSSQVVSIAELWIIGMNNVLQIWKEKS